MRRNRRSLLYLVLPLLLLVASSCDGDGDEDGTNGSPPPPVAEVTLADDGCTYEGPSDIDTGSLSFTLVNDTDNQASFDLWLINEGSFEDLEAHIVRQQGRLDQEGATLEPPAFAHKLSGASLQPSDSAGFATTVESGLYGFVCSRLEKRDPVDVFAAGPLEVASADGT